MVLEKFYIFFVLFLIKTNTVFSFVEKNYFK